MTFSDTLNEVYAFLNTHALNTLGALFILWLGFYLSGFIYKRLKAILLRHGHLDEMLVGFLATLSKYVTIIVTILIVLDQFGVETTSLIALLGAAGLAIGLALQGTLSNVAAGVMILFLRPFKIGHYIEAGGQGGTVKAVSLFTTELATPDNVQITLPNSQVWGSAIKNYSAHATRRVDLLIGIAYEDDMTHAMSVIEALAKSDPRIKTDPAAVLVVGDLADSSVNLIVRVWVDAADYWSVKWDLTKQIKETFDKEGISIPYPQQVVHHVTADNSGV